MDKIRYCVMKWDWSGLGSAIERERNSERDFKYMESDYVK